MRRGFTLIELLVVIAIIGILASVILVMITGARAKGRVARVQQELGQIQRAAVLCRDGKVQDNYLNPNSQPVAGQNICDSLVDTDATWPVLPVNWEYETSSGNNGCDYNPGTGDTLRFTARSQKDGKLVECNEGSCRTFNFAGPMGCGGGGGGGQGG